MTKKEIREVSSWAIVIILGTVFAVVFYGLYYFTQQYYPGQTKPMEVSWMEPDNGAPIQGPILFRAKVVTTKPLEQVWFTVSWEGRGGPWIPACKLKTPARGDIYECTWDPSQHHEQVPEGRLNISFDVIPLQGSVVRGDAGVRRITWQRQ